MDPVATIAWVVAFVLVTVIVTGLVGRIGFSAPVALVVVGGIASFVPWVPRVSVEPDLILFGILPPLLFAAALKTSLIDIRARNDSILLLSVGLVAFTVVVVGVSTWAVLPAVGLAAAFAFAAVVAPTDAVAVTAIAGKVGLPRRVVTILEGESLLNDATALVALNAAIAAIVSVVNPGTVALDFVLAVGVGVAVGVGAGALLTVVRRPLRSPVLDTTLMLAVPFAVFLIADELHGSGVIAVVITGLYVGFRSPGVIRAESRVAAQLVWRTIQFLLENAVFLFIGLNLAGILEGAVRTGPGLWPTVGIVAAILAALILSRFVWVMITTFVYRFGPRVLRDRSWDVRNGIAVASASVRGVVTLAAVFLLPEQTPMREYLQFLAFVVVVASLIGGLALPRIVRALHLPARNDLQERTEVKLLMAEARQAGLRRLDETVTPDDEPRVVELLRADAAFLGETLDAGADAAWPQLQSMHRLRRAMIQAQREAVLVARRERRFQEVAVLAALRAIDAEETSLRAQEAEP
ncbi:MULTISPECIES: cation:proton antiporter [Microbacterium]|jgi:monovalent cation/hydrogen antiporter|uniref:Sodium, potassium, lithium and rubidium/H(+) antiporter n=2 Tax=Microbacterium TaxID=33882 RepID=A0A0F0M3R4_9MICO|nr:MULTISPECIES: cation:proton antiporter [Microbacterium]KJL44755.1 Sodium, potassium, lithium and rubidium/H(+) antiporter [Microbacterium ginsengisoli]MCK9913387.1 cation:proton antiporter [Microbacteriaceae bacterium K1510]ODU78068.1 MAG: Na+/H+ antiporter [Microbacterium sp. SCN 71-21]